MADRTVERQSFIGGYGLNLLDPKRTRGEVIGMKFDWDSGDFVPVTEVEDNTLGSLKFTQDPRQEKGSKKKLKLDV